MNKKIVWTTYIKTSLITMLILTLISYAYLGYDTVIGYDVNVVQEEIPQDLVLYKIEELKKEHKYWDNARICYEIGTLYERIFLFDLATKYYLRSIEKAPKNYYLPHFKLAKLDLERSKLEDAVFIMNLVPKINNKKIKFEKGNFYEDLSVKYTNKNDIDNAIQAIKKAAIYYKSIDKDKYKNSQEEHAYLLMRKSEILIKENKIKEAILILEDAQKENSSAELRYRLAIINYGNNDKKSFQYFEKTQKINPAIINYDLYYALIKRLQNKAIENKNFSEEKYYSQKLNFLKTYINNNFIGENEFKLDNVNCTFESKLWGIKKFVTVNFNIYNNSPNTIRKMYAQIDVSINNQNFSKDVSILERKNIILPYSYIKNIEGKIDVSEFVGNKKEIKGKIYLYKNSKFNKIEIGEFGL